MNTEPASPGALVISLDFELRWGVRDRAGDEYRANLLGARDAIPRILGLFEDLDVAATWATVGFLFAVSRVEKQELSPSILPQYRDPSLNPYTEITGENEEDDPLHFAGSLIERIQATPRQEVGTHTFSHFYCLEEGQDREAFRADLRAAIEAAAIRDLRISSIVFPRNQYNPAYDDVLIENGITAYRGNPDSYAWRFTDEKTSRSPLRRSVRLIDTYLGFAGSGTYAWEEVLQPSGLANVRASYPLRPYRPWQRSGEALRLQRIQKSLEEAANHGRILHLWWHPHNFGRWTDENLHFLTRVLMVADYLRHSAGLLSLSMKDVERLAREKGPRGPITTCLRSD